MARRPEFRDPSIFPCQVHGCEENAEGWVTLPLLAALDVRVETESDRVYLCAAHLRPLKEGQLKWGHGPVTSD